MRLAPFVTSKHVLRVIKVACKFNRLPSEIMHIDDEYTAFCFDEACDEILSRLNDKDSPPPKFISQYNSFSDLYKQYD